MGVIRLDDLISEFGEKGYGLDNCEKFKWSY